MSRTQTPSTVILHGEDNSRDRKDAVAQEDGITPGNLVEVIGNEDSGADSIKQAQNHSTAAGEVIPRFAIEFAETGRGIDDDHDSGEYFAYRPFDTGEEVYAFLSVGETVTAGDALVSDGAGALQASDPANDENGAIVGEALEDVDASGASNPLRIRVEVK